jgi:hypothetical protein
VRPIDPRLLRYARTTRWFLVASVAIGTLTALLVIVQAFMLARIIVTAFTDGGDLASVMPSVWVLVGVVVGRGRARDPHDARHRRA